VALEIVFSEIDFDDAIAVGATPLSEEGDLALAGRVDHVTGDHKSSVSCLLSNKNLVGGEDHVFESFHGIDRFDLTSALLQNTTEIFPLGAGFHSVDCVISKHVWVFLIDDIKIIRRTDEHLGHTKEW